MKKGEIKFFNETKNFGFVKDTEEGTEYFFHGSAVEGPSIKDGDVVEFEGGSGERGPRATKVKKTEA